MVLRRAFSFSDDSVSVALRSPPYGGAGDNGVTWESQLQKLDPAFHLLRMRRLQSAWYQELFQSGRTPYEDPSRHVSAYTDEMRLWWKSTPKSTPSWLRPMYELELLYSSVYVMSPSRRVASMSDRETVSTFEDCIAFSDMMVVALGDADTRSCYTPHEALRLYFIGDRFLDTIWKNQDRLLGPTRTPDNLSASGPDNASRSIRCIEQLTAMLGDFGRRWGRSGDLQIIFNSKSEVVLAMLRGQRRRSGLVAGGVDGAPSYETPPLT
ncbi:MAG: hypothetical protein M1832_004862 [Thelocarpon impressellum]|nr:MAG: hypothetical protein M1832_004862 [Thelocarpon impressellum]